MNLKQELEKIRKDLSFLEKFEVVLYGSYSSGHNTLKSDIDIAVITRETNPEKNLEIRNKFLENYREPYHINVFELLPLHVKAEIMNNYKLVFGDKLELSEYFYHFRKLWKDEKKRYEENQFSSFKEKLEKMKA